MTGVGAASGPDNGNQVAFRSGSLQWRRAHLLTQLLAYIIPVIGHYQRDGTRFPGDGAPSGHPHRTIFGWKRVPATRVAIAIRSRWPRKTFTWRARESSGRLTLRPLRISAAVDSSALTQGNCGRSLRGWMKKLRVSLSATST